MSIKAIKMKSVAIPLFIFLMAFFVVAPNVTASVGSESAIKGLEDSANQGFGKGGADKSYTTSAKKTDIPELIGTIVSSILAFVGLIFFILIIYAGFIWMTAGGNEEEVHKSIELMTRASIGLVIIAAAYLITRFVGETVIGQFTK